MKILIYCKDNNMQLDYIDSVNVSDIEKLDFIKDALCRMAREYDEAIMDMFQFNIKNPV